MRHNGINLSTVTTVIHLATTNDRNGNPRRAYLAFAGSALRGAWFEGYAGPNAVPDAIRGMALNAPRINVKPTEFNRWIKEAALLEPSLCNP